MSVTITGKLNKAASQFQAGESTGFGIRVGVKYYDRETKQNEWTNYECAIFAKKPDQIQFYQQSLVAGAIVEISGGEQKIRRFDGNQGLALSIEIIGARLGFVSRPENAQPQPQPQPQSQGHGPGFQQQQQQQYNQQPQQFQRPAQPLQQPGPNDFDDIPF